LPRGRTEPGPCFSQLWIKAAAPRLPLLASTPFPLVLAPHERLTLHRRLLSNFDHQSSSSHAGLDWSVAADRQAMVSAASKLPSSQSTSPSHPPWLCAILEPKAGPRSPPELCHRRQAPPLSYPPATSPSIAFPGEPLPPPPCPAPPRCLLRALCGDLVEDPSPANPRQPCHRGPNSILCIISL
jgi:hypothetical protein